MSRDYFNLYNSTVESDGYPLSSALMKYGLYNNLIVLSNLNRNYANHEINKQWGTSEVGTHIVDYCMVPTYPILESDDIVYEFWVNVIYEIDAGSDGAWVFVKNHGVYTMITLETGGIKQATIERTFDFAININIPYSLVTCLLELGSDSEQVTIYSISYGIGSYGEHE